MSEAKLQDSSTSARKRVEKHLTLLTMDLVLFTPPPSQLFECFCGGGEANRILDRVRETRLESCPST